MNLREIFVFASATPPQLITEAIQAMACADPPVYADELYVFATGPAKRRALEKLGQDGHLAALCAEWDIPVVPFSEHSFVEFTGSGGELLDDILTVEENEAAGDRIAAFLNELAAAPSTRLHCFLGGGRQTLTFYMGTAFQLISRQWDRMYHVNVSLGFERNEQFYYKPKKNQTLTVTTADGSRKRLNTRDACIILNELPMVHLRDKLPAVRPSGSFRSLVSEVQHEIDRAHIVQPVNLNLYERRLLFGSRKVILTPLQMMVYSAFLRLKQDACLHSDRRDCRGCTDCFTSLVELTSPEAVDAMASDYQTLYDDDQYKKEDLMEKWGKNLEVEYLRQQISKINSAIRKAADDDVSAQAYQVSVIRQYGRSRYGVKLDRSQIRVSGR